MELNSVPAATILLDVFVAISIIIRLSFTYLPRTKHAYNANYIGPESFFYEMLIILATVILHWNLPAGMFLVFDFVQVSLVVIIFWYLFVGLRSKPWVGIYTTAWLDLTHPTTDDPVSFSIGQQFISKIYTHPNIVSMLFYNNSASKDRGGYVIEFRDCEKVIVEWPRGSVEYNHYQVTADLHDGVMDFKLIKS